jgi:hypothetical protein
MKSIYYFLIAIGLVLLFFLIDILMTYKLKILKIKINDELKIFLEINSYIDSFAFLILKDKGI